MARDKHAKGPARIARAPVAKRILPGAGSLMIGGVRIARAPSVPHPKHIVAPELVATVKRDERHRNDK